MLVENLKTLYHTQYLHCNSNFLKKKVFREVSEYLIFIFV